MGINAKILDSRGTGNGAKVDAEGALHVVEHPHPPLTDDVQPLPFREYFTNGAGSQDMNVDGSTVNVDFTINASSEYDIYVKTIFMEIADNGSPSLNKFGAITELTNGVSWIYFTQDAGEYILADGLTTNKSFITIAIDTHGIGTGVDAYLADTSGGGTEKAYLPIIDLGEMYGMRYGVRLKKGTTDRLMFRIKDNISAVNKFLAIANGQRL